MAVFEKRIVGYTIGVWASIITALPLAGQAIDLPSTTFEDKVVGTETVLDMDNVKSHLSRLRVVLTPTPEDPVLKIKVEHTVVAGLASVDIIERTTRRAAEGKGVHTTALAAINVVNPMAWLMGTNPARTMAHGVSQQVTKYTMKFETKPKPLPGNATRQLDGPAAWEEVVVEVAGAEEPLQLSYKLDGQGYLALQVHDILERLVVMGLNSDPMAGLEVVVFTRSITPEHVLRVQIPPAVAATVRTRKSSL